MNASDKAELDLQRLLRESGPLPERSSGSGGLLVLVALLGGWWLWRRSSSGGFGEFVPHIDHLLPKGRFTKKFKIVSHERVREGTFQFNIEARGLGSRRDGSVRVTVYPNGNMQVFGGDQYSNDRYFQSDLSEAQQKKLWKQAQQLMADDK